MIPLTTSFENMHTINVVNGPVLSESAWAIGTAHSDGHWSLWQYCGMEFDP
jgi:hypothetical protein